MTDRFVVREIWRGHAKGLMSRDYTQHNPTGRPDRVAWTILYATPAVVGGVFFVAGWEIASPESLLAGFALLVGAYLAAFAPIAAWRDRLTDRADERELTEGPVRDFLDSTAAHLCLAVLGAVLLVALLIVGMNFADEDGALVSGWAAVVAAGGTFLLLLTLAIVRSLYATYAMVNKVREDLSGLHHG